MSTASATLDLLRHLASQPGHDEVKADFRSLLVQEFGVELAALDFERRVPEVRGRLDALVGRTVFEAKSDLQREWPDIERRMPDYLADREREEQDRFVGIASDGLRWAVFELREGSLATLRRATLNPEHPEMFLAWLDGALALKGSLPPDSLTIRAELGGASVAFHRVQAGLSRLWERLREEPAQRLKRQLWGDLLRQVYGREIEGDALWLQHSYLVVVAKCIAVAVMDLPEDDPARLLSGQAFSAAGIQGAVESDFFDWMIADSEGIDLVHRLMVHIRRFRLREVDSDVLKILYEELIDRDERHGLGEYYTPDWLAAKIVRHAVDRPLEQKVLDPACGSGTFLFHALRRVLAEAGEAGVPATECAREATSLVAGIDIHPVAVIIARVTYLLGLAPVLGKRSGGLTIPVYLGDSMQLGVARTLTQTELEIQVPPGVAAEGERPRRGGAEILAFPETFCRDPGLFDKAIERMRTASLADVGIQHFVDSLKRLTEQHYKSDLTREQVQAIQDLGRTYVTFDRLRREGRDTIWAYVARNLSRPLAFSSGGGWANVLVGNPPWVAYRHMKASLQRRFQELAKEEGLYVGRLPSHNDLCALFAVRASQLYLRPSGRLAFVLPLAALTRGQFAPFRAGQFTSSAIAWEETWTMDEQVAPLFPVPSCVVFGRKRGTAISMPRETLRFCGTLPLRDASEEVADTKLTSARGAATLSEAVSEGGSPYRASFRQGAILVPRALVIVQRKNSGRLGEDASAPLVMSRRSNLEKEPWRSAPSLEGRVDAEFLKPVLLGESILPFRVFQPFEGVVPISREGLVLDSRAAAEQGFTDLAVWLRSAEAAWNRYGKGNRTFVEQLNYINQLSAQFPLSPLRLVYAKAGAQPAACLVRDDQAIIDHMLYWSRLTSESEGHYLCAILNSEVARQKAERFQARGQFGARHFDKVMFNLPIPRFDPENASHSELVRLARVAEEEACSLSLADDQRFQNARKRVRSHLAAEGIARELDKCVASLLDADRTEAAEGAARFGEEVNRGNHDPVSSEFRR